MSLVPAFAAEYAHLAAHVVLAAALALVSSAFSLPSRLLEGVHTYIHPENLSNGDGLRAAIRRPSDHPSPADLHQPQQPRRRPRSGKEGYGGGGGRGKSVFDEASAQLLRLRLVDSHLRTRTYFSEYRNAFISTIASVSGVAFSRFLSTEGSVSDVVPVLSSLFAASFVFLSLAKLSFERSATKRSERQLAAFFGFLGFAASLLIQSVFTPSVFDFGSVGDSLGPASIASSALAGCLSGFLFVPATRAARSLWLGTDQLRWNLEVISCGAITRILLYITFIVGVIAPVMWVKPIAAFPAKRSRPEKFQEIRVWLLFASAASQFVVLRPNLQTYLNEAVVSWYQRLHASKVPDLDFGRAKVFLHNYYLCLVALQFFAAPALGVLFLGLSQMRGNLFGGILFIGGKLTDCSSTAKEMTLFLAWWGALVWAIYTTSTVVLLRWGFLFIS